MIFSYPELINHSNLLALPALSRGGEQATRQVDESRVKHACGLD
jgi:hypothetical protein